MLNDQFVYVIAVVFIFLPFYYNFEMRDYTMDSLIGASNLLSFFDDPKLQLLYLDSAVPPAVEVAVFSDFIFELADPLKYFDIGVSSLRLRYFFSGDTLIEAL